MTGNQECLSSLASVALLSLVLSSTAFAADDPVVTLRGATNAGARSAAAGALSARVVAGDLAAIEALMRCLKEDPARDVRLAAIAALGQAKSCEAVRAPILLAATDVDIAVRDAAKAVAARLGCQLPVGLAETAVAASAKKRDIALHRLLWGPNAMPLEKGTWSWSLLDLGVWLFGYAVTDNVDLTLTTTVPVGFITLLPSVRYHAGKDPVRWAVVAQGGLFIPYLEGIAGGAVAWTAMAGGMVSLGTEKHFANIAVYGGATGVTASSSGSVGTILPSVAGSFRLSDMVRLIIEAWVPIVPANSTPVSLAAILYGMRIQGHRMYGDISFVMPIYKEMGSLLKFLPLGIPLLSFGFTW